jgi:regulator of protease activity HflC (stomatin/prohibitin superfamily)
LIIELLSSTTAKIDRSIKKALYQDRFRTPEYFWFSPETLEFEGYRLVGQYYEAIAPNEVGWRWSEVLGLFLGVQGESLRYFDPSGEVVPTPEEEAMASQRQAQQAKTEAQQAKAEAQQAQAQAQQAEQRTAKLMEQLRSLGVEPEE